MATTGNNVKLPPDVLELLESKAASLGVSADDLAAETLRDSLKEKSWQDLLARGQERGRASGITEEQVPDVVHDWRKEHRGR